jgi:hypothetical protein
MSVLQRSFVRRSCRLVLLGSLTIAAVAVQRAAAAETVTVGSLTFINKGLVGVGRIPADLRDKFGETFGSGSGLVADPKTWARDSVGYRGVLYMLPDRGYNITGTADYHARLNKLAIVFKPTDDPGTLPPPARQHTVAATLVDSIPLTDAAGLPLTGLDPTGVRRAANGFPDMPQAATGAISIDSEAVVLMRDGTFFISDEYGPYVYHFSADGRMLSAIRPPDAFIPMRNGRQDFSSNNPGPGASVPVPADPDFGRQNNQGFEGLSLTPDGKFLVAVLQSATRQDGGTSPATRQNTRMLYYDIADPDRAKLVREHVVPLPSFSDANGKRRIAAQSELFALDANRFLLLCRDSGNGYGMEGSTSRYRSIEILDTSKATNIAGSPYDGTVPVAPNGKLEKEIVPATLATFIDINDNSQLNKFGLHNGTPKDRDDLSEKWEGMALVPALDPGAPQDFFLFMSNDNDFITQNGYQVGTAYKDESGADVDTMILAYRVTLPELSK